MTHFTRSTARWLLGGAGLAAASYAAYVGFTWLRYGHPAHPTGEDTDPLLDPFIPVYEVVERHHVRVAAPAEITLTAATEMDIQQSSIIRAIFKGREWIMRSRAARDQVPRARSFRRCWPLVGACCPKSTVARSSWELSPGLGSQMSFFVPCRPKNSRRFASLAM